MALPVGLPRRWSMATKRMAMQKVREILRMKMVLGLSHREVAQAVGVSPGSVGAVMGQAAALALTWEAVSLLDDQALEDQIRVPTGAQPSERPLPDFARIHVERRRAGVTLELLHLEYLETHPDGYRYTQFCEGYRRWLKRHGLSMRQCHVAGDKTFVDYSGKKPSYVDPTTGEVIECELFVAVLGASNYSYAEATRSQQVPDWVASHVRTFEYFGGVTSLVVCDQLRSGVSRPCRYEPVVQRNYDDLAKHYDTAILPARPGKPKDKAKVEVGVQVVQRWILARLRNQTFFSLESLNAAIRELLDDLNNRVMKRLGVTRRQLFEQLDAPLLKPLPPERFVFSDWATARVNIDYHVEVDGHYYSVPHTLVRELVEARFTATTVEIFHRGRRVASHVRSYVRHRHTTVREHMPVAHQAHSDWSPSRIIDWAKKMGPSTAALVTAILESRPHPEQGYRSCLGLLRLGKRYGEERLERACERALVAGARSYRHVDAILKNQLDQLPLPNTVAEETKTVTHENVRGPHYYH
jgi:transposase